jgi:hypothetical protein
MLNSKMNLIKYHKMIIQVTHTWQDREAGWGVVRVREIIAVRLSGHMSGCV